MPAQISILDLLRTSPIHQEILEKALKEGHVPTDINTTQFETLVGHLSAACALSFKESDIPDVAPDHTLPLRIAVMVRDFAIKRVLVDNGSALNLCTLKFIQQIGFTEADIQHEVITIKAYDNLERTSEGTITLPIQLGPATQDTICHVVDLDLPFNILLGRPWIHSIKAVPSTYHQCIKFPHQGTEVTIHADPNPFAYCRAIEASFPHSTHCPGTDIGTSIASSSRSHCDPETILTSTLSSVKINNQGCGEYSLSDAFAVGALPLDPHTQGRPCHQSKPIEEHHEIKRMGPMTFESHGTLNSQEMDPDINRWLYKDPPPPDTQLLGYFKDKYPQSHKYTTEQWNYQGGGLGPHEGGSKDPITASKNPQHQGLGFKTPRLHIQGPNTATGGTNMTSVPLLNSQDNLIEIEDIPEEKEIRSYDDIFADDTLLGTSVLQQLAINLIDLPLIHPQLIDWDQPSIAHIDEFQSTEALLAFMGASGPQPIQDSESSHIYKLDPEGYFGEEASFSCKKEIENIQHESLCENPSGAHSDSKIVKIKSVSSSENLAIQALEDEDLPLPPMQDYRPEQSPIIIEETRPVNLGTEECPRITYIAANLTEGEEMALTALLRESIINFAWSYAHMPGLDPNLVVHHLAVDPNVKPVKQKLRKMHPKVALLVKAELEKLLQAKIIRAIDYSEWISNMVPVTKPSGDIRICTDFRDLNKACPKDDFPLPNIDMIVDLTAGHEMLSLMDGFSGYNQIRIAEADQHKTAFTTPWGTFCYNMMPFGLKNAGATYQRAMTAIFHDMIHKILEDYVDDILAKSKTRGEHLSILESVFDRLHHYGLKLNPKKCVFGVTSGKLLGFIVSRRGIEIDPKKVKAIIEMPPPRTLKQLRSLQGKLQSVRRFISQLADKCQPFTHLLCKDTSFKWDPICQRSFDKLKEYLANSPILVPPVPGRPLILYISTTTTALGALLAQHDDDNKERAIYYISRTLVKYELNYSPMEKACLAVVFATQKLRHYMLSHTIRLISKVDPLKYLLSKTTLTGRMAKWVMLLSEFDIQYIDRKAIKGQVIADQLAEAPLVDAYPLIMEFPDEHLCVIEEQNMWKLYFDGSYTSHGSGAGILFVTPQGDYIPKSFKLGFLCTNNIAEYEALILGLRTAIQWNITELQVFGDSQLIIKQVLDEYQTKDDKLLPYKELVNRLKEHFLKLQFIQIPRLQNKAADAMATIGSLLEIPRDVSQYEFLVEQLHTPAYENADAEMVCVLVGPQSPWYHDILAYLKNGIISPHLTNNQRQNLIRRASRYTLVANTLYRRGYHNILSRCLDSNEAVLALQEVHAGICGAHTSGMVLAKQLLRVGYYWPTMEHDACEFVKKCLPCQQHANLIHAPAQDLQPIAPPWPFSCWGFDLVGLITPLSSDGHKYIITATEYFTKWVEAIPLTLTTGIQISKFILYHIICRFGIPSTIFTDHGTPFENQHVDDLCARLHIHHRFSSPYFPQGNGQAEATNKTLLKLLKKVVNDSGRDWHLQINPALWAYRTSYRTPTGTTPYSLVYGAEAVLPIEVELPSLRVSMKNYTTDEDYRVARLTQLDLLDEKRQQAYDHLVAYQNRLKRSYNKKVHPRQFQVGDMVLKENQKVLANREKKGKFEPTWLGPYVVTASFGSGAYQLSTPEGEPLNDPINIIHLKRFYA